MHHSLLSLLLRRIFGPSPSDRAQAQAYRQERARLREERAPLEDQMRELNAQRAEAQRALDSIMKKRRAVGMLLEQNSAGFAVVKRLEANFKGKK